MISVATSAVALSGALSQTDRVSAAAANLANQQSIGALPANGTSGSSSASQSSAYQPVTANTVSVGASGGSATVYRPITPSYLSAYQPDSSSANANGLVAVPNIDSTQNLLTLKTASSAYQANLAVIKTTDQMNRDVLRLTA